MWGAAIRFVWFGWVLGFNVALLGLFVVWVGCLFVILIGLGLVAVLFGRWFIGT